MNKFTNPLDNIRIASPCKANWNEMSGDDRRRHCAECKLNVYNLSGMTRAEAENLLINAEGRLCVRFYRRSDGTVLTKDCPVGWQAIKRNISVAATAAFSLIVGLFSGIFGFVIASQQLTPVMGGMTIEKAEDKDTYDFDVPKSSEDNVIMGNVAMPEEFYKSSKNKNTNIRR